MEIMKTFKNIFSRRGNIAYFTFMDVENKEDFYAIKRLVDSLEKSNENVMKDFYVFVVSFTKKEYKEFYEQFNSKRFNLIPLYGSCTSLVKNVIISLCFTEIFKRKFERAVYLDKDLFFIEDMSELIKETRKNDFTCLANKVYEGIHTFEKEQNEVADNVKEYNGFKGKFLSNNLLIVKNNKRGRFLVTNLLNYSNFDRFVIRNKDKIDVLIRLGYILEDDCLIERILADNKQIKVINPFVYKIWAEKASFADLVCINMQNFKERNKMLSKCNSHKFSCLDQTSIIDDLIKTYTLSLS